MNSGFFYLTLARRVVLPIVKRKGIKILFVKGKSGSGKTTFSLILGLILTAIFKEYIERKKSFINKVKPEFRETFLEYYKNPKFEIEKQIVFQPFEYKKKLEWFINNPHPVFIVDELRFLVPAKLWQKMISQTFSDVNATVRSVKASNFGYGGVFIYNSQFFSDITKDIRRTVDFLVDVKLNEELDNYAYFIEIYEFKIGENYISHEKKNRTILRDGTRIWLNRIRFPDLPPDISKKLETVATAAKSEINRIKQEKLEKMLIKEFGLKGGD